MSGFNDKHMGQSEDELRKLEDERDVERASPRARGTSELPSPLYRIKAMHSNETFFAYFTGVYKPEPPLPAEASAVAETEDAAVVRGGGPAEGEEVSELIASGIDQAASGPHAAAGADDELPSAESGGAAAGPEAAAVPEAAAGPATIPPRTLVVAPTRYGRDICEVQGIVKEPGSVGMEDLVKIERVASPEDLMKVEANKERELKAFEACKQRIAARNLPMKLVSAHYLLEEPKVLFYFSAESRVDFRELVKDLVSVFKMRIELRQIGVRDEARVTGGCGVCGRVLCCHGVTDKLTPVSIKMAKDQNLSLNSMKISGPCGRLLCCLAYEYGFYRDARRELPNEGARFPYDGTLFRVIEVNALAGTVKMAGEDGRLLDMSSTRFAYAEGRWQIRPESADRSDLDRE